MSRRDLKTGRFVRLSGETVTRIEKGLRKFFGISVWAEYTWSAGVNVSRDAELESLAKQYGGKRDGSGFMFPTHTRDISFRFESMKGARAFIDAAVKLSWVTRCARVD